MSRKPIPKVKGKGKYDFKIKHDPKGWYLSPEMMGHRWAKESLDSLEKVINTYSKSKLQKQVLNFVFGTPAKINQESDWHFFCSRVTKKDVATLQFTLRKVDNCKDTMFWLLNNVERKVGILKTRLNWILELLSYQYDHDLYLKSYSMSLAMLGMKKNEAKKRFEEYHKKLATRKQL